MITYNVLQILSQLPKVNIKVCNYTNLILILPLNDLEQMPEFKNSFAKFPFVMTRKTI